MKDIGQLEEQLLMGSAANKKIIETFEEYESEEYLEEAASLIKPYLTENQEQVFNETVSNMKKHYENTRKFYDLYINSNDQETELERTEYILENVYDEEVDVKAVNYNSYGLNVLLDNDELDDMLEFDDPDASAGEFYYNPSQNIFYKEGHLKDTLKDKQNIEGQPSLDNVRETEENSLMVPIMFFTYEGFGDNQEELGLMLDSSTYQHERSHIFDKLYPQKNIIEESTVVRTPDKYPHTEDLADLKESLREETVAGLIGRPDLYPGLFTHNKYFNYSSGSFKLNIEDMIEQDRNTLKEKIEERKENIEKIDGGAGINKVYIARYNDALENNLVEKGYQELLRKRDRNQYEVETARDVFEDKFLAEIIRNIDFDRIPQRLPKVLNAVGKDATSRYTEKVDEILNLDLG